MNIYKELLINLNKEIRKLFEREGLGVNLDLSRVSIEPPRDTSHGDIATNAAMVLAKQANKKPKDLALLLVIELEKFKGIESAEVAGPGFINFRFTDTFWHQSLGRIVAAKENYGRYNIGKGRKINVEFVSANPTGPLHVGHARGTVFGDVLASLLEYMGYDVTREYYVNDAGSQVDRLARSVYQRYLESLGYDSSMKILQEGYPGEYLSPVGAALAEKFGASFVDCEESKWLDIFREFAIQSMIELIRDDLRALGVRHDLYSFENELVKSGAVQSSFDHLKSESLIYEGILEAPKGKEPPDDWEPRSKSLFRASDYGDEIDRPLKKSDGTWTYFATDIAYHCDKFERGFAKMIDVWGADHGGYVARMKAAIAAISSKQASLDIKLIQMVRLTDQGKPVLMSKRSGSFVTLRELVDEVGKDVVRFLMLTRKNDAPLDFDLSAALEQSKDNPVFYLQYAHARIYSVLRRASEELPGWDNDKEYPSGNLSLLTDVAEINVIKVLAAWPRVIDAATNSHEPHRIAFYLQDLAASFHSLWSRGNEDKNLRFIIPESHEITMARLILIRTVASVISIGLSIFAIEPVREMR